MSDHIDDDDGNASRALQRQSTAELSFFTPSSISFNPKPYFPHASHASSRIKPVLSPTLRRELSSSIVPQKLPDVSYNDPDATFIRYPFTAFPDAHLYPEGLTYSLLAENPNWFLDSADFRMENDTDPNRVPYPQALEPPRGWCPTKKKDIKEKGTEAYGGEDAPKLRCTFCRRGYAGVNAKSMWRRHVLEKHKIPMSNRRDGPSEGGGRGRSSSNKENNFNKRSSSSVPVAADSFTVQAFFKPKEAPSRLLPAPIGITESRSRRNSSARARSSRPLVADKVMTTSDHPEEDVDTPTKPSEPEFAPDDDARSSSVHHSPQLAGQMLPPSSPLEEGRSQISWRDLSSLPPSPTRTPSSLYNRRGQFTMPWKFPSPSHPLYSGPDELCLAVPIGGMTGEGLRSSYVALQASPFPGATGNQSQFSSPIAGSPLSQKPVTGRVLGWKRSKNRPKSKLPPLPEPSPRRPLYSGPLPVPMSDNLDLAPTPDLTMSTDSEADTSFSNLGAPFSTDAFSSWFEMNSPGKEKKGLSTSEFPDTPLRRSMSSSAIDQLQLVGPGKGEDSSSMLLPSGFGLGFNFKFNLTASGAKRARSEDGSDHESSDEFGELLYPSEEELPTSSQQSVAGPSGHKYTKSSLASAFGDSIGSEDTRQTDVDSEDLDSIFGESIPIKKRRLRV